jgi:hypothetical protein
MCLRQKGQINPLFNTSRTFLLPLQLESENSWPLKSINVKSGASVFILTFGMVAISFLDFLDKSK